MRSGQRVDEDRLRTLAYGDGAAPLTEAERDWCVREAVWAAEGGLQAGNLTPLSDKDLATEVLHAWWDYALSNVL